MNFQTEQILNCYLSSFLAFQGNQMCVSEDMVAGDDWIWGHGDLGEAHCLLSIYKLKNHEAEVTNLPSFTPGSSSPQWFSVHRHTTPGMYHCNLGQGWLLLSFWFKTSGVASEQQGQVWSLSEFSKPAEELWGGTGAVDLGGGGRGGSCPSGTGQVRGNFA